VTQWRPSNEDLLSLERIKRDRVVSAAIQQRAAGLLALASGASPASVADRMGCHPATVRRWARSFVSRGIQSVIGALGGRPRTSTASVEAVIGLHSATTGRSATSIAIELGLNERTVRVILSREGVSRRRKPPKLAKAGARGRPTLPPLQFTPEEARIIGMAQSRPVGDPLRVNASILWACVMPGAIAEKAKIVGVAKQRFIRIRRQYVKGGINAVIPSAP